MSADRLIDLIIEKKNPTVVGLDPRPEYVPRFIIDRAVSEHGATLKAAAEAVAQFNRALIDAVCDLLPAVKPQAAYYEMLGVDGMIALKSTIEYARERGLYVIADCKRGDIGATAEAYASAWLGAVEFEGASIEPFGADAVTVNPYLGSDGVKPFAEYCGRGRMIFVLCKTSNKSSGELQDLATGDVAVYRHMGELIETWGAESVGRHGYSGVGAVVGATYPHQLEELRAAMPHTFFLVPGYGAQGGSAADIARAFDSRGLGAIVNSSRAVMCAWQKTGGDGSDFAEAARAEVLRMKAEIGAFLA